MLSLKTDSKLPKRYTRILQYIECQPWNARRKPNKNSVRHKQNKRFYVIPSSKIAHDWSTEYDVKIKIN